MGLLDGKVIIVTGATTGIGQATAIEAAREGAKVVLAGRSEAKGQAIVAQIKQSGGNALFVATDVTKETDIQHLVQCTLTEFGQLDGAFNNAGIVHAAMPLETTPTETFEQVINTNLRAIFWCMKYQLPQMKKPGGAIVNCSSISGVLGFPPGLSSYITSKHAIIGLSKAAAVEYAKVGIRVNTILPGSTETSIWEAFPETKQAVQAARGPRPLQRSAQPLEMAKPVVFLLSDSASYITGTELVVDGGYTAL